MKNYDVNKIYEWPVSARLIVVGISSILILLIGYVFDLSSLQSQIASDGQQLEDSKQQLEVMLNKQVSIANGISQLPKLKALLAEWQQNMVDKSTFPTLLNTLLKYGADNNLKFSSFQPGKETKAGLYTKVPVNIEMTGTFTQMATFISQVANLKKMILIGDFSIKKEEYTGSTNSQSPSTSETLSPLTSDEMLVGNLTLELYRK